MEWLGLIGVIAGLAFLVAAIYKGFSLVIAAPLATMIVVIFNGMPFIASMFGPEGSYMAGLAKFLLGNFPVFLFGAILAKYMDKSGAALSIARTLMRLVGTSSPYRALVALLVISAVLTYGGINIFVVIFILIPMAMPIFAQYDIPRPLIIIPIFGGGATFTMTMLPASPALHNVVPSNALKTPLTAAPVAGVLCTIAAIAFLMFYMKVSLTAAQKRGEHFDGEVGEVASDDRKVPSFAVAVLPIVVLLGMIFALSFVKQIILFALFASIILAAVLFHPYVDHKATINGGTTDSLGSVFTTGSTIAFGSFAVSVPAFESVFNAIQSIPGGPLVTLSVTTMLLAGITASSVGAEGIAVGQFGPDAIAAGVNAEIVHRMVAVSAGASLFPHNGFLAVFNNLAGLTLRNSFTRAFISMHVPTYIGIVIILILANFGIA
ncbi:H+/gluconate symporter-like permease [Arcanobacterium wilhelmae]|uniref:H+/gluconate symporter-like permease n=1 Tax=Arcanobacterium wilhelmae TaxID=1803177 RepID=A0ABT9NB80_9ACTO|nr:hypothetical protein [Arcanobacterium wilhelmae]MDP9800760.1 H+/gluconate symporter-like permease [Arcanobacterium wilhelmae]